MIWASGKRQIWKGVARKSDVSRNRLFRMVISVLASSAGLPRLSRAIFAVENPDRCVQRNPDRCVLSTGAECRDLSRSLIEPLLGTVDPNVPESYPFANRNRQDQPATRH